MGPLPKLEWVCVQGAWWVGICGGVQGQSTIFTMFTWALPKPLRKAKAYMLLLDIGTCKMS
jgi:hypothetical protein